MKKVFLVLMTLIYLSSCSKSDQQYLKDVSNNLSNISSIEYTSSLKSIMDNQVMFEYTRNNSIDYTGTHPNKIRYKITSEDSDLIYDGLKTYQSINADKIITVSDNNSPERVNNPLMYSINYLRNILPKLIDNENVTINKEKDTTINTTPLSTYNILIKKSFIHPFTYDFIEADNDTEFSLLINKNNHLPYQLVFPNGPNGLDINTFQDIKLSVKFDDSFWSKDNLPKDYAQFTEEEYFKNRKNSMESHIGEQISDFELPSLNDNTNVNFSDFKGNVVLLDFWFKGCQPCISAIPDLNNFASKFSNDNFKIFGVEFNENHERDILLKYKKENNAAFPNLYQGKKLALHYGITGAPTFMIIDKQGKIIHIKSGYSKEHMDEIKSIIEKSI